MLLLAAALDGVYQHRQERAVGPHQVKGHLVEEALHPQQRREVGLEVDLPGYIQQVLESSPHQDARLMA